MEPELARKLDGGKGLKFKALACVKAPMTHILRPYR